MFDLTIDRIAEIVRTLNDMSWQSLNNHSPDDLLADAEDMHRIAEIARSIANDLDFHNTHPSTRKAI
jgi:hypothetical protein